MKRSERQPIDMLSWERQLWAEDIGHIAGVDEVGRGAFAGPLVAAAVILPGNSLTDDPFWLRVQDSKTLPARTREELAAGISERALAVSIAQIEAEELDLIGLSAANRGAMERAVNELSISPDMLLVDAMWLDLDVQQIGIIDGDAQSLSIAAASIVAKVHRDRILIEMDALWPAYGFGRHKGYGVPAHRIALQQYGPCPQHRRSFKPVSALLGTANAD